MEGELESKFPAQQELQGHPHPPPPVILSPLPLAAAVAALEEAVVQTVQERTLPLLAAAVAALEEAVVELVQQLSSPLLAAAVAVAGLPAAQNILQFPQSCRYSMMAMIRIPWLRWKLNMDYPQEGG